MMIVYTMICFTPWIPSIEAKMQVGYVSCFLVTLHFIVNLQLMLRTSCKGAFHKIKIRQGKKSLKQ